MSFQQQACFVIHCDDCGEPYTYDGEFEPPHFGSQAEAAAAILGEGFDWRTDGMAVICSDCSYKPHPFRLMPNTTDECWRCPHPADEHEENSS